MRKKIDVEMQGKTVAVEELPIGKYAELLQAVKELPKHLGDMQSLTPDAMIEKLPYLISVALPDVLGILEIATPFKREDLEDMGLADITALSVAVITVNNYSAVFESIKKVVAQGKPILPQTAPKSTGSTGQ